MNYSDITNLILSKLSEYGTHVLVIITAVIGVGLAYLVFRFGWEKVKTSLGGGVSYGDWEPTDDWGDINPKYAGKKIMMRRRYEKDDSFDEYQLDGKKIDPWLD